MSLDPEYIDSWLDLNSLRVKSRGAEGGIRLSREEYWKYIDTMSAYPLVSIISLNV